MNNKVVTAVANFVIVGNTAHSSILLRARYYNHQKDATPVSNLSSTTELDLRSIFIYSKPTIWLQ